MLSISLSKQSITPRVLNLKGVGTFTMFGQSIGTIPIVDLSGQSTTSKALNLKDVGISRLTYQVE